MQRNAVKSLACAASLLAWGVMVLLHPARAWADDKEYLVKAAFIYNFTKFVQWPADGGGAFNICTIGGNPFRSAASVFKDAQLSLVEFPTASAAAAGNCKIAFSTSDAAGMVSAFKGKPVLLVGNSADFIRRGGMIGFTVQEGKIKLVVNSGNISAAGLRVDAQLLEIALEVIR